MAIKQDTTVVGYLKEYIDNHFNNIDEKINDVLVKNKVAEVAEYLTDIRAVGQSIYQIYLDLEKGNFFGNRKTDVDLALNKTGIEATTTFEEAVTIWTTTSTTVYYSSATALFVDGTIIEVPFINDDDLPVNISTHGGIIAQLDANVTFTTKLQYTSIIEDIGGRIGSIIRISDTTGHASNLERLTLHVATGLAVDETPIYFWAETTSALQTLAQRVGDIIALGNNIDDIILLANSVDQMLELQSRLDQLVDTFTNEVPNGDITIYNKLDELMIVYTNIASVLATAASIANVNIVAPHVTNIDTVATVIAPNITELLDVNNQSAAAIAARIAAEAAATIATTRSNEIKTVSVDQTVTGAAGTNASVVYNASTGKFTFIVPQGIKGDKGDSFEVNAVGLFAGRSVYNDRVTGFSFLAIDLALIYFKLSAASGDWSIGAPFGKGDQGAPGSTGLGIASVAFSNTTDGSGLPVKSGATDTYTITYTDASIDTFSVYNGVDGSVAMTIQEFTATTNQTTFTVNSEYTPGLVNVYLNGVKLSDSEFTATNGTDIILALGATAGDIVNIDGFGAFKVADNYTKAEVDTKDATKAPLVHTHVEVDITDLDKYTQAQVDAALNLKANSLNPTITGLKETSVAMVANDIDLSLGNHFTKTISGATTFTVSNVATTGTVNSFILELTNAGSATITWFAGVKFAGGVAPTLTTSGVDILGFYTKDGGTTYRGIVLAKDSK